MENISYGLVNQQLWFFGFNNNMPVDNWEALKMVRRTEGICENAEWRLYKDEQSETQRLKWFAQSIQIISKRLIDTGLECSHWSATQ